MNYLIQLRDCVIWCLNNLIEIITQPTGKDIINKKCRKNLI